MDAKIVSWNILAPELMFFFWRSSYGLEVHDNLEYYHTVHHMRIQNIIHTLSDLITVLPISTKKEND